MYRNNDINEYLPENAERKLVKLYIYIYIYIAILYIRAFFNIQAGGANAPPQSPLVPPPPRNHILPPQEKSLFPKIIQTNQRRLTNR